MNLAISTINYVNLSTKTTLQRKNTAQINFGNRFSILPTDEFEKCIQHPRPDAYYNLCIKSITKKINAQLHSFTPEKLENAICKVRAAHPQNTEQQILTVMQKLTQWANYTCLPKLACELRKANISHIENSTPFNRNFYYFQHNKGLFSMDKTCDFTGVIVTKNELKNHFKTQKQHECFVNLEGFDDGVNLFSDDENLANCTIKTLEFINKYQKRHPLQVNFSQALNIALNGSIIKTMHERGFKIKTLRVNAPATRETILAQMAPVAPTSDKTIETTIDYLAKHFTNEQEDYWLARRNIASFYDNKLDIYTKQRLIDILKETRTMLNEHFKAQNVPEDKVFYLIPNIFKEPKSFIL